jgi:molybdopterin-containing oxidoreductase family membrane subunit
MAVQSQSETPSYGIAKINVWLAIGIATLLSIVVFGAVGYYQQLAHGEIVTGLRDVGTGGGAPWGLYITFELYTVGVGFGSMILIGIIGILRIETLRPLVRPLALTTIVSLVVGYMAVIADLGQPLRAMINIARYARPMSPFFGTFTIGLVTSLTATIVFLYLDGRPTSAAMANRPGASALWRLLTVGYRDTEDQRRRRRTVNVLMSALLLVLGIAAASSSGFVFSMQPARPGWFSAMQSPSFVALAATSATAIIAIIVGLLPSTFNGSETNNHRVNRWLNNVMLAFADLVLYFLLTELITASYSGQSHQNNVTEALFTGKYAWAFWGSGCLFLVAFVFGGLQALARSYSLPVIFAIAIIINMAAWLKRLVIVTPSLTHGNLLPYGEGSYSATWVSNTPLPLD